MLLTEVLFFAVSSKNSPSGKICGSSLNVNNTFSKSISFHSSPIASPVSFRYRAINILKFYIVLVPLPKPPKRQEKSFRLGILLPCFPLWGLYPLTGIGWDDLPIYRRGENRGKKLVVMSYSHGRQCRIYYNRFKNSVPFCL